MNREERSKNVEGAKRSEKNKTASPLTGPWVQATKQPTYERKQDPPGKAEQ
jgi:hypothetical protein